MITQKQDTSALFAPGYHIGPVKEKEKKKKKKKRATILPHKIFSASFW